MKNLVIGLALLISATGFAATNSSETAEGVVEAVRLFEDSNSEETVANFKGIKASANSHGVTVEIFLKDKTKIKYGCHRHGAGDPFECHED